MNSERKTDSGSSLFDVNLKNRRILNSSQSGWIITSTYIQYNRIS